MGTRLGDLDVGTDVVAANLLLVQQGGVDSQVVASELPLPFNYIGGLITSNDTDADHDIAIAPGAARSADDAANLKLASILTKQIDGLWVVGDDQPGLDTGAVAANTLYALWLIKRPDTGVVDAIFSTSFTTPDSTRIPDYTKKRLIAAVKTDSSNNIIAYLQSGDYFRYMSEQPKDVDDNTITSETLETGTLSVPPGALAHINGLLTNASTSDLADGRLWIITKGASLIFTNSTAWILVQTATFPNQICVVGQVLVDSNSQIEYAARAIQGAATITITTHGFTMLTRREP